MSAQEINRAGLLQQVVDKQLTQVATATIINLSERQVRRLMVKYRKDPSLLAHSARGRPSNRRLEPQLVNQAILLIGTKYPDFGPTFASEKLEQLDGLKINRESLRKAMINAGLWQPKRQKAKHRTRRERCAYYGEMEQFDGCHHDWFEGRNGSPWVTLLASRDDADNTVRSQFVDYEGTIPVMSYWLDYFKTYGKPQSIYLDRHSTYKINAKSALDDDAMLSQFERAMATLGVSVIHANSPQAKGRIENLFGTLQDRLVKELRLASISTISEANNFLQSVFLPDYNKRFCVTPVGDADVHQPLVFSKSLLAILSVHYERLINQDFTIRFKNQWLQLNRAQPTLVLPKKRVVIEERLDGSIHICLNGHYLSYKRLDSKPEAKNELPIALTSNPDGRIWHVPAPNHPWRKFISNTPKPDISTLQRIGHF